MGNFEGKEDTTCRSSSSNDVYEADLCKTGEQKDLAYLI